MSGARRLIAETIRPLQKAGLCIDAQTISLSDIAGSGRFFGHLPQRFFGVPPRNPPKWLGDRLWLCENLLLADVWSRRRARRPGINRSVGRPAEYKTFGK